MTTSLVEPGSAGRYRFIRQQDTERARPYTSCRIAALMMQLLDAGIEFPDDTRFLEGFRKATGVAEVTASGESQGTTAADVLYAAEALLPWITISFGPWEPVDLLEWIRDGHGTASVVAKYSSQPARLRVYSPRFTGTHQFVIRKARIRGGTWEVLWVDCLGPKGHNGTWVKWSTVRKAIFDGGAISKVTNRVFATTIEKGAGLSTFMRFDRGYEPPATVTIPKGTEVFEESPRHGKLVRIKNTSQASVAKTRSVVKVSNYPASAPSGPMVLIEGGGLDGKYVRKSAVAITEAPVPGDCQAAVDAAVMPLNKEIKEQEAAIAAALELLTPMVAS